MQQALAARLGLALAIVPSLALAQKPKPRPLPPAPHVAPAHAAPAPVCAGDAYADDLTGLAPRVREFERDPNNQYSYCLRTTATYECLSYASDGSIRKTRKTTVAHGTGFAYQRKNGETYLLTNDHVASWPAVTGDEQDVDGVPPGCKRVSETVKIVDDENDDYEGNDIPLSLVVTDPALDAAVLKTHASLKLIPYKVGRSASLRVGNVVAARGFPLGAFAAQNVGKIVNAYDHDTTDNWDHVDFVTDALLSPGNSGSPVLALSCKTGEYELVGIYHAAYARGSALNVVIGVDQLRDLMTKFKRSTHASDAVAAASPGAKERDAVVRTLAAGPSPFFPYGGLVASVTPTHDGALWFEVYAKGFPLEDTRLLLVEDLPPAAGATEFGHIGRVFVGNARGLRPVDKKTLDGDSQAQIDRVVARLRTAAVVAAEYRGQDPSTRQGTRRRRELDRQHDRAAALDADAAQAAADLADRLGPKAGEHGVALGEVLAPTENEAPEHPLAASRDEKQP